MNPSVDDLFSQVREKQHEKRAQQLKNVEKGEGKNHAVGYIRVSTRMQVDEGHSLCQQENKIKEYCQSKNLILDKIYRDEGLSGGDRKRPGLNEMLDNLVSGMKVITLSIDRIARDSEHLLNIKNTIHDKKCSMMILDRGIDTAKEESNLLIGMLAAVAEAERSNTKAKISSVMLDMSRRGALRGKPRFGYKIVDKVVVEDEEEQKIISIIRSLIEQNNNITLTEICKRLTMENIVIRKSEKIYPTTIKNIILANKLKPP